MEEYRGLGWYEYRFETPDLHAGNRVWLHFEVVYRDATIWINGVEAGSHRNSGYTAFHVEVTPYLKAGENLLVVAVDNRNSDIALPKANSFDWADDGGIIRNVTMVVTGEAAINYVNLEAVPVLAVSEQSAPSGTIKGSITLHEALNIDVNQVELELFLKQEGLTVWSGQQIAAYPCTSIPLPEICLDDVNLWHFDHPNLYEMTIRTIFDGCIH
ncbi:sugar-binding domain-containing protein [Paenibacillus sp. 8b26]|uniref:sugar-binding domain-containing protein n=1 Tax=Paenibacillus sp. 8b26 TaxID=3424133 RepID=UPI003D64E0BC